MTGRRSFRGGVQVSCKKHLTEALPSKRMALPEKVIIPLQQHTGAPAEPTVKVGDYVALGQLIGDSGAALTSPIHATVSGTVRNITYHPMANGLKGRAIIIESDGMDKVSESLKSPGNYRTMDPRDIRKAIRDAGIVGLGGAAFPTYFKLSPPPGKKIDVIVLNGAECEPYLTSDHRLMVEESNGIIEGASILMRAAGVSRAIIGIEENKLDAISSLRKAAASAEGISVLPLRVKYPQGAEKQLIKALTGREIPPGGLPLDVGVIVNNVGTAFAVSRLFAEGMPLIERLVTVTGSCIKEPANLWIRIGTPIGDAINACGGLTGDPAKVILGGPMMGLAQHSMDVVVTKGTSGILVLSRAEVLASEPGACIRCGKCVSVCPLGLEPGLIAACADRGDYESAERNHAMDCMECGSCAFVCPAGRHLVQSIRHAKSEIIKLRKNRSAS